MPDGDKSGAPIGLIELARKNNQLLLIDDINDYPEIKNNILIDYPPLDIKVRELIGYSRFIRLNDPITDLAGYDSIDREHERIYHYALIR